MTSPRVPPPEVVTRLDPLTAAGRRFATLYADPPWRYDQTPRGAAEKHYPTMTLPALHALPVARLAADDAHLHLWATHSFYAEARGLMAAWGFDDRSLFVWVKPQLGMGHYWRSSAEFLLLGVRGRAGFRDRSIPNGMCVPRGRHSEKPDLIRKLIEVVSPGPYLELFGRKAVPGWTVFGNEVEPPTRHSPTPEACEGETPR